MHRRNMEERTVKHVARSFYFRFVLAFILAMLFGFGSFYLILKDHAILGTVFVGFTFISMLAIFTGESQNKSENSDE